MGSARKVHVQDVESAPTEQHQMVGHGLSTRSESNARQSAAVGFSTRSRWNLRFADAGQEAGFQSWFETTYRPTERTKMHWSLLRWGGLVGFFLGWALLAMEQTPPGSDEIDAQGGRRFGDGLLLLGTYYCLFLIAARFSCPGDRLWNLSAVALLPLFILTLGFSVYSFGRDESARLDLASDNVHADSGGTSVAGSVPASNATLAATCGAAVLPYSLSQGVLSMCLLGLLVSMVQLIGVQLMFHEAVASLTVTLAAMLVPLCLVTALDRFELTFRLAGVVHVFVGSAALWAVSVHAKWHQSAAVRRVYSLTRPSQAGAPSSAFGSRAASPGTGAAAAPFGAGEGGAPELSTNGTLKSVERQQQQQQQKDEVQSAVVELATGIAGPGERGASGEANVSGGDVFCKVLQLKEGDVDLELVIGQGTFGEVFQARFRGEPVALKMFDESKCSDSSQRNMHKRDKKRKRNKQQHEREAASADAQRGRSNPFQQQDNAGHDATEEQPTPASPPSTASPGGDRNANESLHYLAQELAIMADLRHPNVLCVYGASRQIRRGSACLVTELASLGTFEDVLGSPEHTWESARERIVLGICRGLCYLHHFLGDDVIVHHDIKPSNILINDLLEAKIADFGVSVRVPRDPHTGGATRLPGCTEGTARGSPIWLPPEVHRGESYDEKVDVFAFSLVLCEALVGDGMYVVKSYTSQRAPPEQLARQGFRPVVPDSVCAAKPAVVSLVRRCWAERAQERPAFTEICATMNDIVDETQARIRARRAHLEADGAAGQRGSTRDGLSHGAAAGPDGPSSLVNSAAADSSRIGSSSSGAASAGTRPGGPADGCGGAVEGGSSGGGDGEGGGLLGGGHALGRTTIDVAGGGESTCALEMIDHRLRNARTRKQSVSQGTRGSPSGRAYSTFSTSNGGDDGALRKLCQELQEELHKLQEECEEKMSAQKADYEKKLADLASTVL